MIVNGARYIDTLLETRVAWKKANPMDVKRPNEIRTISRIGIATTNARRFPGWERALAGPMTFDGVRHERCVLRSIFILKIGEWHLFICKYKTIVPEISGVMSISRSVFP